MKRSLIYLAVFFVLAIFFSCHKEVSFENSVTPAKGSLISDFTGECLPKTVAGSYVAGKVLTDSNYIEVQLTVTAPGSYTISTDTSNGYSFKGTGTFSDTGANTIRLKGIGTPATSGVNLFAINFDSSFCLIQIDVLPAGSGGPAAFNLQATGGNCAGFVVKGGYATGVSLNTTNKVDISVNVTAAGIYTISTAATNGMTFSASGSFAATGVQTVTLAGTGKPTAPGSYIIPVTAGSSSCNFLVNVGSAASGTLSGAPGLCTPATVDGIYTQGAALDGSNTVDIEVTVATAGVYTITSNTVSGFSFSTSGSFATTGVQTVTLDGTGTPTASGIQTFTITFGSSSCTFDVNVVAGATIDWKFTEGAATYQGSVDDARLNVAGLFSYSGSSTNDALIFVLADLAGGIQNNETYSSSSTTNNTAAFIFSGATESYGADNSTPGVNLIFKITSHNTGTKTIIGTFSGTVKNSSNVTKTITNGQFKATYP